MQLHFIKAVSAAVWVSALCGVGLVGNATSLSAWAILAVFAVLPPLVMLRYVNDPAQTMSQSIQEVLR